MGLKWAEIMANTTVNKLTCAASCLPQAMYYLHHSQRLIFLHGSSALKMYGHVIL